MTDKPANALGYRRDHVELARAACLHIATILGDLAGDIVVVGGLVPSLIVDQRNLPDGAEPHAGTLDLDLGLALAVLDNERYQTLAERLRVAGFSPDRNSRGQTVLQRWRTDGGVMVDFLVPPGPGASRGGRLRHFEKDFAAIVTPGLSLAFQDVVHVQLDGRTLSGERAQRTIQVCGPGAFMVLKALAFDGRGESKDAYDLFYVLRNFGNGPRDVADRMGPLMSAVETKLALDVLRRDFADLDAVGPARVASFLTAGPDDAIQAEVVGFVGRLLALCGRA